MTATAPLNVCISTTASKLKIGDKFRSSPNRKVWTVQNLVNLNKIDHPHLEADSILIIGEDCKQLVLEVDAVVEIDESIDAELANDLYENIHNLNYVHPCEKFLYDNADDANFWKHYRADKEKYAFFSAEDVAELAAHTRKDFWHLVKNIGFGCKSITVNQVTAYYEETRPGYTVDVVATQE